MSPEQSAIVSFIESNPPLDCIREKEHFVVRMCQVYSEEKLMRALKEIISYCAIRPKWEKERAEGNMAKTVLNWLKRSNQLKDSDRITINIGGIPNKQNDGLAKKEAIEKLEAL